MLYAECTQNFTMFYSVCFDNADWLFWYSDDYVNVVWFAYPIMLLSGSGLLLMLPG